MRRYVGKLLCRVGFHAWRSRLVPYGTTMGYRGGAALNEGDQYFECWRCGEWRL